MQPPTVILDRDGVLNRKPPQGCYVRAWEEFIWQPGAKEALQRLHHAGIRTLVITNQAGIARGMMSEEDVARIHEALGNEAAEAGGSIQKIYHCPHHWDDGCECRKPKPGLFFQAHRDFNLNLSKTYYLGDDECDRQAAEAAGCRFLRVTEENSLLACVDRLIRDMK